jgi:Flp pilus assembly protein TadG
MARRRVQFRRAARLGDKGNAMVEFAIAAPIMITLTFGGAEIARAVSFYLSADQGLRNGVRYLARIPGDPTTKSWAVTNAKNLAAYGSITAPNPVPATVVMVPSTINNPTKTPVGSTSPETVTMTANVPFSSPLLSSFGVPAMTFRLTHTERVLGQ